MSNGTIDVRILSIVAGVFLGVIYTLVAVSVFILHHDAEATAAFGALTAIFAGLVGAKITSWRKQKQAEPEKEYLE